MALYADPAALGASQPGRVVDGLPSRHRALRAAAYALGGIEAAPPGGWALARISDGAGTELAVLARLAAEKK